MDGLTTKGFEQMSLARFLTRYHTHYEITVAERDQANIDLEHCTDSLESQGIQYFYVSYNQSDILNAFMEEPQVSIDDYDLIQLVEGPCIAIQR